MRILLAVILLGFFSSSQAVAQDGKPEENLFDKVKRNATDVLNSKPVQDTKEAGTQAYEKAVGVKTSADNRGTSRFSLFYIPVDAGLVIPSKTGFAATFIATPTLSVEAEYISASLGFSQSHIDIIEFSEKLMTGKLRWYPGNSFNLNLGYGLRQYEFGIGDKFLSEISGHIYGPMPAFKAENQVAVFGLGNRWQLDNGITLGVDWFELIVTTGQGDVHNGTSQFIENENDRKNVEKFLKYLRYGPTFNVLKLELGYTF